MIRTLGGAFLSLCGICDVVGVFAPWMRGGHLSFAIYLSGAGLGMVGALAIACACVIAGVGLVMAVGRAPWASLLALGASLLLVILSILGLTTVHTLKDFASWGAVDRLANLQSSWGLGELLVAS